ncbi:MAG: DUF421 domain-containing protein [Bacilli bacterium]
MNYLIIVLKVSIFYWLVKGYKSINQSENKQLTYIDLIITFLIANSLLNNLSLFKSIILIIVVIFIFNLNDILLLNLLKLKERPKRKSIVIINEGKINFKEMLKQKYTLNHLLNDLKKQKIYSIDNIDTAILKKNNHLLISIKKIN